MIEAVAVVVLAGGEGRRIGGGKPQLRLRGRRLIDRAVRQARGWSAMVAVTVRDSRQVEPVEAVIIPDDPAVEGPLGGLVAALGFARDNGRTCLLTIPADMPFLPRDLLGRLSANLGEHGCAIAESGGHLHPVCALWRVAPAETALADYLASGRRALKGAAEAAGMVRVAWPAEPDDPFFNVNTSADLAEAERRIAS